MSIFNNASNMMYGSKQVSKVMRNGSVIWQKQSGDLPSGYTKLDTLEVNPNIHFELDVETIYSFAIKGTYVSDTKVIFTARGGCYYQSDGMYLRNISGQNNYTKIMFSSPFDVIVTFDEENAFILLTQSDGTIIGKVNEYSLYTTRKSVVGISKNASFYNGNGTIDYIIQKDRNGNIIGNYIPCKRDSDDTVGLYNTVTNVFCYTGWND